MNFKRVLIILLAALLLPGVALAQTVTRATFLITKNFEDDNTAAVTVTLNCFTGLPLTQSQDITDTGGASGVDFVVESFESGALDCSVSEEDVVGYSISSYSGTCNSDGEWEDVVSGAEHFCIISNLADPVEVTVTKDWEVEGSGGDALDPAYSLVLWCNNEIEGGVNCNIKEGGYPYGPCGPGSSGWIKVLTESGTGDTEDEDYTADVVPDWDGGTACWVDEEVYDSSVEVDDSDCNNAGDILVELASAGDEECTIVNTVFYEGIPTLSQYGLAIMALLMLGVGFVGFRRFV